MIDMVGRGQLNINTEDENKYLRANFCGEKIDKFKNILKYSFFIENNTETIIIYIKSETSRQRKINGILARHRRDSVNRLIAQAEWRTSYKQSAVVKEINKILFDFQMQTAHIIHMRKLDWIIVKIETLSCYIVDVAGLVEQSER